MRSYNKILFFVLFFLLVGEGFAKPVLTWEKSNSQIISEYLNIHKQFGKQVCSAGTEEKYWGLSKKFRGDGYFVPLLANDKLDRKTIGKNLPELKKKRKWIKNLKRKLSYKKARWNSLHKDIKGIRRQIRKLVNIKRDYFANKSGKQKRKLRIQSRKNRNILKKSFSRFLKNTPFLLSYGFPVDHLKNRERYDQHKYLETDQGKRKSNEIYFYRKLVEDGAQNKQHKRNDIYLRASLDTITLEFKKTRNFLSEKQRYDLTDALKSIEKHLRRGKRKQLERLAEWEQRIGRQISFYKKLYSNKKINGSNLREGDRFADLKAKARFELKDFVLSKQRDSYRFWTKQSELMQALYSLETILVNEVGEIDGKDALERKDVAQVVINRSRIPYYYKLSSKESLYPYLSDVLSTKEIDQNKWINLMLKQGEFSFSYFFIPATVRIFCPSMTKREKKLRRKNLDIALNLLETPNNSFSALRYFSRASMIGRIDMTYLWDDFKPIAERTGKRIRGKWIKRHFKKRDYRYLYQFLNPQNELFKVIRINGRNYVANKNGLKFYNYRNPHRFKYFYPEK